MPDGDNQTSVQVLLDDDGLITVVHTRSDYNKGDIISFVAYILGVSNYEAFRYTANLHGFSTHYEEKERSNVKSFLDKFSRLKDSKHSKDESPIPETAFLQFVKKPVYNLFKEGVSYETQEYFEICFDVDGQRIVYPIRNGNGDLISFKGRTVEKEYKTLGIAKFYAYYSYSSNLHLYGAWQNRLGLRMSDNIIVVEGEKSVLKAHSMGYNNVVSVGKKRISTQQFKQLLSYGKPIVVAFDKDVSYKELQYITREFKGVADVYVIIDKWNLLGEKDSPFDADKKTLDFLYDNMVLLEWE